MLCRASFCTPVVQTKPLEMEQIHVKQQQQHHNQQSLLELEETYKPEVGYTERCAVPNRMKHISDKSIKCNRLIRLSPVMADQQETRAVWLLPINGCIFTC